MILPNRAQVSITVSRQCARLKRESIAQIEFPRGGHGTRHAPQGKENRQERNAAMPGLVPVSLAPITTDPRYPIILSLSKDRIEPPPRRRVRAAVPRAGPACRGASRSPRRPAAKRRGQARRHPPPAARELAVIEVCTEHAEFERPVMSIWLHPGDGRIASRNPSQTRLVVGRYLVRVRPPARCRAVANGNCGRCAPAGCRSAGADGECQRARRT